MSEIMAKLAENYQIGIGVTSGILIVIYVVVSIFAIIKRRKLRGYVSVLGMIPFFNISLFFKGKSEKKGNVSENGEVIEDMF